MKKKFTSKIVFVRHGHRDKPVPDADNGLSSKGQSQVDDLVKALKSGALPQSEYFWTSPKKRCVETLGPLSKAAQCPLQIEPLLDEQHAGENMLRFQERLERLLEKAEKLNSVIYCCSHGDVIPEAIELLTGRSVDISKGQAIIVENQDGKWTL